MKDRNPALSAASRLGVSLLITVVVGVILLFSLTGIAYSTTDPASLVMPLSMVALCVCSLVCGFSSAKLSKNAELPPILSSAVGGIMFVLILFLLTVLPIDTGVHFSGYKKAIIYIVQIGLSLFGGLLGRPRGKKRKSYRKRISRR